MKGQVLLTYMGPETIVPYNYYPYFLFSSQPPAPSSLPRSSTCKNTYIRKIPPITRGRRLAPV